MRIIEPSATIESWPPNPLDSIEAAGRTCYKSEPKGDPGAFVAKLRRLGHLSVFEHVSATVRFVVDRGVSHELVRHRLCAFSQESTRYCNYGAGRFGGEVTFIRPLFFPGGSKAMAAWTKVMLVSEQNYFDLIQKLGASPQEARCVLPNSLKTELVVTTNFREWRHIFNLRCSEKAHPQMRQVMLPLEREFAERCPEVFR